MHKLISIGLSPNVRYLDVRLAVFTLLQPWIWFKNDSIMNLRKKLANILDTSVQNIFLTISGRSAIYQTLKVIGVRNEDEVIVQAFTCVAVVNPILWLNAKPVYVDIKSETLNIDVNDLQNKITKKTKAIIIQHTFGLPFSEIGKVKLMIGERDISIIEDCAHSLGAQINNHYVGTLGDFGVLSFGRDKMISSVFGGALIVNNQKYLKSLESSLSELPKASKRWIIKQLFHPVLTSLITAIYHLGVGKIVQKLLSNFGILSKATSPQEKRCGLKPDWICSQYPNALARLALQQLNTFKEDCERRNIIAKHYESKGIMSTQSKFSSRVWLRYPVLVNDPDQYFMEFKKLNIYLGDWYNQVVAPKEVSLLKTGYQMGMTPNAEKIAMHIINLPVHPKLTDFEVDLITSSWHKIQTNNIHHAS